MSPLELLKIEHLVERYADGARRYGVATSASDFESANVGQAVVADVYRELRRRGRDAQNALLPLLDDESVGVRIWAGAHALEFAPDDGERVLEELVRTEKGIFAFNAKNTLQEWRAGRLLFP